MNQFLLFDSHKKTDFAKLTKAGIMPMEKNTVVIIGTIQ
jgi:hypothetical protein